MANVLTTNPLFIDTSGATSIKAGFFRIKLIKWVSDDDTNKNIADTDQLDVVDSHSTNIVSKLAHGDGDGGVWEFNPPLVVEGINVSKMDGGVLYVYR